MNYVETSGRLHSNMGLNLGIPYHEFLDRTRVAEKNNPGTRDLIVKKAILLENFRAKVFEFGFLSGMIFTNSIGYSFACAAILALLETAVFYSLGDSLKSSSLSWLWTWLRLPVYAIYIAMNYPIGTSIWIVLAVLFVFEGWLGIFSTMILMIPMNMVAKLTARLQGAKEIGTSFYHRPRMSIEIKINEFCAHVQEIAQ